MRLHGKLSQSSVNGPGERAVIWYAGCGLSCPGCHNPTSHTFEVEQTPIYEIAKWIYELKDVEGVTFSGGEPMQHLTDLLELIQFTRSKRPDLSIGMFTGYTLGELESGRFQFMHPSFNYLVPGGIGWWELVKFGLDFAVMGRFNESKITIGKPMCGSSNQAVNLFTSRYTLEDFKQQETEVTISANGLVRITGFPGVEFLTDVRELL